MQLLAWAVAAATTAAPPPAPGWSPDFKSPFTSSVFSYDTLESSMFAWQGKHYMMEGIACNFWSNDSAVVAGATMDPVSVTEHPPPLDRNNVAPVRFRVQPSTGTVEAPSSTWQ